MIERFFFWSCFSAVRCRLEGLRSSSLPPGRLTRTEESFPLLDFLLGSLSNLWCSRLGSSFPFFPSFLQRALVTGFLVYVFMFKERIPRGLFLRALSSSDLDPSSVVPTRVSSRIHLFSVCYGMCRWLTELKAFGFLSFSFDFVESNAPGPLFPPMEWVAGCS